MLLNTFLISPYHAQVRVFAVSCTWFVEYIINNLYGLVNVFSQVFIKIPSDVIAAAAASLELLTKFGSLYVVFPSVVASILPLYVSFTLVRV